MKKENSNSVGAESSGAGGASDSFEAKMAQLEEVVKKLESDDVPLEDSIRLYEQGMEIHKKCEKILSEAKLRIEKLSSSADEEISD